jgi:hypothetical protein
MFFDNFFNNIQSQPAAFVGVFCGKEPLQDLRQNLRGNPLAPIRDAQKQDRIFIYSNPCRSRKFFTPPQPSPKSRGGSKKFTNDARIAISPLLLKLCNCPLPEKHCKSDLSRLDLLRLDSTVIQRVGFDNFWPVLLRILVSCKKELI